MGRTFEVLGGRPRKSASAEPATVPFPAPDLELPPGPSLVPVTPDDLPADDDAVPHVEVGGPRKKTAAGPSLLPPRVATDGSGTGNRVPAPVRRNASAEWSTRGRSDRLSSPGPSRGAAIPPACRRHRGPAPAARPPVLLVHADVRTHRGYFHGRQPGGHARCRRLRPRPRHRGRTRARLVGRTVRHPACARAFASCSPAPSRSRWLCTARRSKAST